MRSPRAKRIAISVAGAAAVLVAVALGAPRLRAANSARAEESLMQLIELAVARSDHAGAVRQMSELRTRFPQTRYMNRLALMTAQLARLQRDSVTRAESIASAARTDSIASAARADSIASAHPQPAAPAPVAAANGASEGTPSTAAGHLGYAVQVAAFETIAEANASAAALTKRGLSARVVPGARLFLLQVGHYDTREEARLASLELKARSLPGFVVSSRAP